MASDRLWRDPKRRIVLLDTSAVFMIFEQSIRLEDELDRLLGLYEIQILTDIKQEIKTIAHSGSGKQKRMAKTGLAYIQKFTIIPNESGETVDDTLFHMAKKLSAIVITNDKELKKRLLDQGITTLCLRGKNQLMIC